MKKVALIFMFICLFISSCDRLETNYKNYKIANENKFFEKGWIPENLIYESMSNIYLQNDIDINSAFFMYNLSSSDLDDLKTKIHIAKSNYRNPTGIKISSDWIEQINKSQFFYTLRESDTVYLALDSKDKKVFGWYNSNNKNSG